MSDPGYLPELYALTHRGTPGDAAFYAGVCRGARRVLELGCGYGRLIPALAGSGAHYQGLELLPSFLRLARRVRAALPEEQRGRVSLRCGDMRDFSFRRRFDRILLPHSALFCLSSHRDVARCFACIREHLHPQGELVLDAYMPDSFHRKLDPSRMTGEERDFLMRIETAERGYLVFERTRWIRARQQFVVTYEYESESGECLRGRIRHRYLLREQLEELLVREGFSVIARAGGFSGTRLTSRSEQMVLRARHRSSAVTSVPRARSRARA